MKPGWSRNRRPGGRSCFTADWIPVAVALILSAAVCAAPAAAAPQIPTAVLTDGSPGARAIERRVMLDRRLVPTSWQTARLIWSIGGAGEGGPAAGVRLSALLARVRDEGVGLVLVPGATPPDLRSLGLATRLERKDRVSLLVDQRHPDRTLTAEVVWQTAPQVVRRWIFDRTGSSLQPAVLEQHTHAPVLLTGQLGRGRVMVFSLQLAHPSNEELVLWPYHNYLLHVLSSRASQAAPDTFARWPAAPVPGKKTISSLLIGLTIAWLLTLGVFFRVRRHSKRHPEILDRFFADAREAAARRGSRRVRAQSQWRTIGFARSLAGFLTLAGTLFLLFAPFYYVTNILIPNDVQPFPQAKGIWEFAWEALQVFWFLFDFGTYVAFVKYFAEYRIKDPAEAVRSAQFFTWWQILTGLVQVTIACVVAVVFLPRMEFLRPYGYISNFIILVALSQYPGVFAIMNFFFQAFQRYDYNIGLDLLSDWVLRFGLQIPFVLIFRAWGAANPEYGEAFGAAVGIGCGFYFSQVVTFALGTFLYKRLGLKLTPLFMAHFDRRTAKRMLWFGARVVAGKVFFRAAKFIDRVVISVLLINYTEWLGLEGQIHYNLMFLFPIAYRFFETAMAALSESYGNGKKVLTQYYLARFFQVGALYTAIGLSLFLAMGPTFVRHAMDPQWGRAADFMIIAAVAAAFSAPAWISDMLQKGAGRPGLFAIILGVEQALRIGLFWVLIPRYQFWGFYWALLLTITIKVVGAWVINHLLIVRVRVFLWQMLVAPAIAGTINFALLRLVDITLGLTGRWEVVLLFFAASLLSFFVCFFAMGLAGGMDRALALELEQAWQMTGPLRPLTRLFYLAARAGWNLSPLHNRFPVVLQQAAMEEATALERQRQRVDRELDAAENG